MLQSVSPLKRRRRAIVGATVSVLASASLAMAGDVTWTNGSGDFNWNTTSSNWSTGTWKNANVDGAIFGAGGVGTINLAEAVTVNSMAFNADGYVLGGPGSITFAEGTSTQTTGVVNVSTGLARVDNAISSAVGFQKIGPGVLQIGGKNEFTGSVPLVGNSRLTANVLVGGAFGNLAGGTLRLGAADALPKSTRLSIGNGYLDLNGNDVRLEQLTFINQGVNSPWNSTLRANNGVVGAGKLEVTGQIHVLGVTSNSFGNSIAADLDLGGKEQFVRVGASSALGLNTALMFTGTLSNGGLTKTAGYNLSGNFGSIDGISLHGNNTYTGPTRINTGTNVITGTNASMSVTTIGVQGAPGPNNGLNIQGANGSILGATVVRAVAGSTLTLDNNIALGANGNNQPNIPAAQNNNRLRDDAALELRFGTFNYRGFAAAAATETFGSLGVTGGHNTVTLTPNGGGSVTVNATGSLALAPRATLTVQATGTGNTLGGNARLLFGGSVPAADSTGILPRMANATDFLRYDAVNGFTPNTVYATDFNTPGTNVSVAAAATIGSQTINALKRAGTNTLTISDGSTLNVTSGMLLNSTGTATYAGGTIAFGSQPGVLLNGFNTSIFQGGITGSAGLIHANGTTTLTATSNLSGLSGPIDVYNGSLNLANNNFLGPINVRLGTLNITASQTAPGMGPITLGSPENDVDLLGTIPELNISGAGVNAVINRDIVVDNGTQGILGEDLSFSFMTRFSPLSNTTGSQTLAGNLVLKSPLNIQGGAGTGTGATLVAGKVSGPARLMVANGRVIFTDTSDFSSTGGINVGGSVGFTAQVTFQGTASGNGPYVISPGNSNQLRYEAGSLTNGPISVLDYAGLSGVPSLIALENSTITNRIVLNGAMIGDPLPGVTAVWAGPLSGDGSLVKLGTGTLVLSSTLSTHLGDTLIDNGILRVDGTLPSPKVFVRTGGRLEGSGAVTGTLDVTATGTLAPGSGGIGGLATGSITLGGLLAAEIAPAAVTADLLSVSGTVTLGGALQLAIGSLPDGWQTGTYLLVANDGTDPVSGVFSSVSTLPPGFSVSINYAFSGTDSLSRTGTGNDIAVTVVPEPSSLAAVAALGLLMGRRRRRHA